MSWTINDKKPAELGVTVASFRESANMEAQELSLNVAVDSYAQAVPAELVHNNAVTLKLDSQIMFQGKVRTNPKSASGSADSMSYSILDAWDELDRTPYQQMREYVTNVVTVNDHENSIITTAQSLNGAVEWEADVPLGERIRDVISYAASVGVNIQIGNIIDGITWFRSPYKDMSCGAIIRALMELMPERVLWLDNRATTPTMHMRKRSDIPAFDYDLSAGTRVIGHQIKRHDSEQVAGVAIRYEKPLAINTGNYTSLTEDIAGDVSGVGVITETIALQGAQYQAEYATATCEDIPQVDADAADILAMWIKYTPELAAIADIHTVATVASVLKLALADKLDENVQKYALKMIDDGNARPDQINPNAEPIVRTENVEDYKRVLVEGTVPAWAEKRYRMIRATATIAIEKTVLDAIGNAQLKKQFEEIFNLEKEFDGKVYMTSNFTGEMMATNAQSGNYKRTVTFDQGEPFPTGIAAQFLEQINTVRHSGSFGLVGDQIDTSVRPGQRVNFTGKDPSWTSINEQVLSVSHDLFNNITSVEYGPAQQLGAVEFIDRLRATRKNQYSHGLRSDKPVTDGVGGSAATPVFKFSRVSGGGGGEVEECILGDLLPDPDNAGKFKIRPGYVYGGGSNEFIEKVNITPLIGEHLYIEVSWTAEAEDGVLLTGGSMTSVEIKQGGSVPDDDDFTPASLTGKHRKALGTWTDDNGAPKWNRDGCGSYHVRMCSNGKTGSF